MAFLTLNEWPVDIADGDAELHEVEVGASDGRGFTGTERSTRRALKREGSFSSSLLSEAEGYALRRLLTGDGWHFPFDSDLYSEDTGFAPNTGYTATLGTATPSPKFGTKRVNVPTGTSLTYATGLGSGYTVMVWAWDGASTWNHWAVISDDSTASPTVTRWKDGAANAGAIYHVTVSGGSVSLNGKQDAADVNASRFFDDLVILPWVISSTQLASWAAATLAFSALPKLDLGGDVLREATPIEVRASLDSAKFAQFVSSGSWSSVGRRVSFKIREV